MRRAARGAGGALARPCRHDERRPRPRAASDAACAGAAHGRAARSPLPAVTTIAGPPPTGQGAPSAWRGQVWARALETLAAVAVARFLVVPAALGHPPGAADLPWRAVAGRQVPALAGLAIYAVVYRRLWWSALAAPAGRRGAGGMGAAVRLHARFLASAALLPAPVLLLERFGPHVVTHVLLAVLLMLAGLLFGDLWRAASAGARARRPDAEPPVAGAPARWRSPVRDPAEWALRTHVLAAVVASADVGMSMWLHGLAPLLYLAAPLPGAAPRPAATSGPARARMPGRLRRTLHAADAWARRGLAHPAGRYGVPAAGTAGALGLATWMRDAHPTVAEGGLLFFLASVVASSVIGGLRLGLAATVLAVAAIDYFLLPPVHTFAVAGGEALLLAVFNVLAVLASWGVGRRVGAGGPGLAGAADVRRPRWRVRHDAGRGAPGT